MSNRFEVFPCNKLYFSSILETLSFCCSTTLKPRDINTSAEDKKKKNLKKSADIMIVASPAQTSAHRQRQNADNASDIQTRGWFTRSFRLHFLSFVFSVSGRGFRHFITLFLWLLPLLHLSRHFSTLAPLL